MSKRSNCSPADVDVITYEFENVPAASAMILAARRPVLPNRKILETTQDRLAEKDFVRQLGIGTADYADVSSAASLRAAIAKIGLPAVLKTRRFGYDGKGQAIIRQGDDPDRVWEDLATKSAILEAFIPFEREISVIAARNAEGQVECFDVTENEHRDHILNISRVPAAIPDALAAQARGIAEKIATALNYVGVLAVELFVVEDRGETENPGQRDRAPGAQFRALDAGRRVDLAVRAAYPRHRRLAARQAGPAWPGDHDQSDRGRDQRLRTSGCRFPAPPCTFTARARPARPENGPCHPGFAQSAEGRLTTRGHRFAPKSDPEFGKTGPAHSQRQRWTIPPLSDTSARSRLRARPFAGPLLYQNFNPIH